MYATRWVQSDCTLSDQVQPAFLSVEPLIFGLKGRDGDVDNPHLPDGAMPATGLDKNRR